jgi:hypothetical protein
MWLCDGSLSDFEVVKKLSINDYYALMKYIVDRNREQEKRHNEILSKNG